VGTERYRFDGGEKGTSERAPDTSRRSDRKGREEERPWVTQNTCARNAAARFERPVRESGVDAPARCPAPDVQRRSPPPFDRLDVPRALWGWVWNRSMIRGGSKQRAAKVDNLTWGRGGGGAAIWA